MTGLANGKARLRKLAAERDALQLALAERAACGQAEPDGGQASRRTVDRNGFDAAFYLEYYPDVAKSGMDPLEHYEWLGRRLGRAPNALRLKKKSRSAAGFWLTHP